MRVSDTLRFMWGIKLRELMAHGYDPYNSLGPLKLGKISLSWRT